MSIVMTRGDAARLIVRSWLRNQGDLPADVDINIWSYELPPSLEVFKHEIGNARFCSALALAKYAVSEGE